MNTFDDMKKKAAYLVESAENRGYEFNNIELSILSIVGRAESYKDISPYLEEMFYKFYPDIKKKISSKR